jgi:hypothetical protein
VPATPDVVTVPLTDLSISTLMVPLPVAAVATGGASWAPFNTTFEPVGAWLAICCAHPAARSAVTLKSRRSVRIYSASLNGDGLSDGDCRMRENLQVGR